jgi:hypothetical protein
MTIRYRGNPLTTVQFDDLDAVAQGFAGVGYQIQGIRNNVVRGDHLDLHQIADQPTVAYQLVRSCHGEASRTIAEHTDGLPDASSTTEKSPPEL